ncbi:MAG: hypothetical protein PPP58_11085 [Natronomonas sp.]
MSRSYRSNEGWSRRIRQILATTRGQSSPIGVVLIIGITLLAATTIVLVGSAAIDDTTRDSQLSSAEKTLTSFDSRAAQVGLGDSTRGTVSLDGGGPGTYQVDSDAGEIRLTHEDYDGEGSVEDIGQLSMGEFVYELDGTTIAYQGGGVWRQSSGGGVTMISPPEFHYRGSTLTLPMIQIDGDGALAGTGRATVTRESQPQSVFPSGDQYDGTSKPYANPIENGTFVIEIESRYCEGWRGYLQDRTDGDVSECVNDTVTAELVSFGTQGEFPVNDGNELLVRGVEELEEFELVFRQSEKGQSTFNSFDWSMSEENGDQQFEVYFNDNNDDTLTGVIYYSDDGGETYEAWSYDGFEVEEDENGVEFATVDLLGDTNMTYDDDTVYESGGERESESLPVFRGDAEDHSPDTIVNGTVDPGDTASIKEIIKTYVEEMGDMNLDIQEGNAAEMSDSSFGNIDYDGDGRVVQFIHVTENEVRITLG